MNITVRVFFSLLQKIVLLHDRLELRRGIALEDGIGKQWALLLQNLELALNLVPCLGHLRSDHREIAAVPSQQCDQLDNLSLRPIGGGLLFRSNLDDFLLFLHPVLKGYLIDEGLESGNRRLNTGIFMAVGLINSHVKDSTGSA